MRRTRADRQLGETRAPVLAQQVPIAIRMYAHASTSAVLSTGGLYITTQYVGQLFRRFKLGPTPCRLPVKLSVLSFTWVTQRVHSQAGQAHLHQHHCDSHSAPCDTTHAPRTQVHTLTPNPLDSPETEPAARATLHGEHGCNGSPPYSSATCALDPYSPRWPLPPQTPQAAPLATGRRRHLAARTLGCEDWTRRCRLAAGSSRRNQPWRGSLPPAARRPAAVGRPGLTLWDEWLGIPCYCVLRKSGDSIVVLCVERGL